MTTKQNVERIIEDGMMSYSAYVLLDRALPDLRDGLKPVHRRILYTMYLQKAYKLTKSANISGAVMKIHPHGDSYGSMVGMVQKDRQSIPLLIGKGNFGQYTSRDIAAAASRYSEVKLSDFSIDMMKDFDKNIVDFIDNYDGTMKMPEVLPVKFPSILTIAQSGIGVGFSSSTASFNLNEVCDATIDFLKTGNKQILVPDFATGGFIIDEPEAFNQINTKGNGTVKLRGKAEIEGNEILITEVPYSTTREAIIEKIVQLSKAGKMKEVIDVKDLTGLKGMLVSVTARKGTDMKELLEKLYRFTPLQATYSANMNILLNDLPKVLSVHDVIEEWTKWRRESIERGLKFDINKLGKKLHLLRGLEKVLIDIDEAIEIIRHSKEEKIEIELIKKFEIDEDQAKEVSNMKLRNINKDYIIRKIKDIESLETTIEDYKQIIGNEKRLNDLVIEGLEETKEKFGVARKTKVIEVSSTPVITLTEDVPNYPVTLHLTKEGYAYKSKNVQEITLKPGDEVIKTFETKNDAQLLVFSKDVLCHKVDINRIEETKANNLGVYLPTLIRNPEIEIMSYSILDDKMKMILAVYENNKIAKISMKVFGGNRRILKNAYHPKQGLVELITLEEDSTVKITTDKTEVEIDTSTLSLASSRLASGVYCTRKGKTIRAEVA